MVLPPYVYRGDWREMKAHVTAIIRATPLSCMLYNNPIAYGTDFLPEQIRELAQHENLHAVKESSGDVRRITAVQAVVRQPSRDFGGPRRPGGRGRGGGRGRVDRGIGERPSCTESMRLWELATAGR